MSFTESLTEIVSQNRSRLLGRHDTWLRVGLADVAEIMNGFPFASSRFNASTGTPLLRIRDILRGETDTLYDGDYDPAYVVEPGDLVVGMDGDFNSSLWTGRDALLNQRCCKIIPDERFYHKRFLAYALPGYLAAINAATSSVTVKHLSSFTIAEIPLPLPPLPEQHRIVEEIEKQFSRLDEGVANLKRVKANLKRYRASVLQAACEGRLVPTEADLARSDGREYEPARELLKRILVERRRKWEENELAKMRAKGKEPVDDKWKARYKEPAAPDTNGLPGLPEGWCWGSLEAITSATRVICYGILMPKDNLPDGIPYVRVKDIVGDKIDVPGLHKTAPDIAAAYARASLESGDLLLTIRGTYGRVATVPPELDGANITQDTVRIDVDDSVNLLYVAWYLRSDSAQKYFHRVARGVAVKGVNVGDVRPLPVPLPPPPEQHEIVAEVERRLSIIDQMETAVETNLKRAQRLRQAILKRAFEGKLVPQDPNDEPAGVLLERIRAERNSSRKTGKRTGVGAS